MTRAAVLALPKKATPMGYGLGKSGWVSIRFEPSEGPPRDTIKRWVMESDRVQAPKCSDVDAAECLDPRTVMNTTDTQVPRRGDACSTSRTRLDRQRRAQWAASRAVRRLLRNPRWPTAQVRCRFLA